MDLSARTELDYLARIVEVVNEAVPGAEWILVGALARDLLLHYAHGIAISRATTDVDLAIAVRSWEHFSTTRQALLDSGRFESVRGVAHQVTFDRDIKIDLVPFGGIERSDGTIAWPPGGHPSMTVTGFSEALRTAIQVALPHGQRVAVVCLPMLLLLKLMAWQDRRHRRPGVDAEDIMLILRNYTDCGNLERMAVQHADLMERADFDYELAGSILAGRDLAGLLAEAEEDSPSALELAREIVRLQIQSEGPGPLVGDVRATDMDNFRKLLEAFSNGLSLDE